MTGDTSAPVRLFCCGDVMTGRGIDQILPHSVSPELHEPCVRDARDYVRLAEQVNGGIPAPVCPNYIWGDALDELERQQPELRLINLETAVTEHDEPWPDKGIHYRMHPDNIGCLTAAGIDCCCLANNHVLDWQKPGLRETLDVLRAHDLDTVGAGENAAAAVAPVHYPLSGGGRLLVWGVGLHDSGIPLSWAAGPDSAGIHLADEASLEGAESLARRIKAEKRKGDLAVVSVHWGGNWGFRVPEGHREFARRLINAGADLIHGHSCHHPRPMELYRGKAVFYGCGDFINDYEGIGGHEAYRPDLRLMFFPELEPGTGELHGLTITVLKVARLCLHRAGRQDAEWICGKLNDFRPKGTPAIRVDQSGQLRWP